MCLNECGMALCMSQADRSSVFVHEHPIRTSSWVLDTGWNIKWINDNSNKRKMALMVAFVPYGAKDMFFTLRIWLAPASNANGARISIHSKSGKLSRGILNG